MRHRLSVLMLLGALPLTLGAQFVPDARTVPAGALRVSFVPRYVRWDQLYDADGDLVPLGFRFLSDTSALLFPTLATPQEGLRTLTGDPAFVLSAGAIDPRLDADFRRFPLGAALGVTSWLTLQVELPIVTTTVNAFPTIDTAGVNAGLSLGPDPALRAALLAAVATLEANLAAGQYGCPLDPRCATAMEVRDRASAYATAIGQLDGTALLPLANAAAGQAMTANLAQLEADLAALGITLGTALSIPLPAAPLDSARLATLLSEAVYGYALTPLAPSKHTRRLGDLEVGIRLGLVQRPAVRLVLSGMVRLPTAGRGRPEDPIDLAPGDRQTDIVLGLEAALDGGRLGLWVHGRWEIQRPGTRTERLGASASPLQPVAGLTTVTLDRGDIVRIGAWPSLRLTEALRVLITADWTRRGADRIGGAEVTLPSPVADAEGTRLMIGGGLWYRSTRGRHAGALPIEAGLVYRAVYAGSGGRVPRSRQLDFGLRLYYGLW